MNEINDETLDAIRLALKKAKNSLDYHCFYSTRIEDDGAYKAIEKAQQLLGEGGAA